MIYVIIILALILLYVVITYNNLIRLKNKVEEAFSTMDVYFKKRWDLIPNIIETVKGYVKHEKETLKDIVELRNSTYDNMSNDDKVEVNNKLEQSVSKIIALAENYPELKASQNFIELSNTLSKVEDDIANARKYYNGSVRELNNKIQTLPSNIIAKIFGFKICKFIEINEKEREVVKVEF